MSSVKHNQSPRCTPLYKPRGPPINSGWLADLSLRADRRAEASRAADIGLNPDADVRGGLLVSCPPGADRFILSQRGEKCPREAMVLHRLFTTFWPEGKEMCKCSQMHEYINVTFFFFFHVKKQNVVFYLCKRNKTDVRLTPVSMQPLTKTS